MPSTCSRCGRDDPGPSSMMPIKSGIRVCILKSNKECRNCVTVYVQGMMEEFASLFRLTQAELSVRWAYYKSLSEMQESEYYLLRVHVFLERVGILSRAKKNNWVIVSRDGVDYNPSSGDSRYYFSEQRDAREYASHMIPNAMDSCDIHNNEIVVPWGSVFSSASV